MSRWGPSIRWRPAGSEAWLDNFSSVSIGDDQHLSVVASPRGRYRCEACGAEIAEDAPVVLLERGRITYTAGHYEMPERHPYCVACSPHAIEVQPRQGKLL